MKTAYITDDTYLQHDTGIGHPESIRRLEAIGKAIEVLLPKLTLLSPVTVSEETLRLVHSVAHIARVKEAAIHASSLDADTHCSRMSYLSAVRAAGAGVAALNAIMAGSVTRVFCAVRPPGHHARPNQAMGFCLFNSVAIAAKYAQRIGYGRVMIVDFDVHHGNGTQEVFYADDTVFYFSSHQAFAYPGTGEEGETGEGRGEGYTVNCPLMPDSGDAEVLDIYHHDLPAAVAKFKPEIILVSAGYDLHESDPLAQLQVTTNGVREMVRSILHVADVPFVFLLEGGYAVDALGENVKVTIEEMLDR